jgi:competence protein ComEC
MALMGVLFLDPLSVTEAGFWLSFAAVAAILYAFSGRIGLSRSWLQELVRTQWALGLGLLPLLAFFFHRAGMTAPLANLVLVPVYCFLVLPLVLTGVLCLFIWPGLGGLLLKCATALMAFCWPFLDRLAHLHSTLWPSPTFGYIALLIAVLGAIWLLTPRGVPARWLGAVLMLPLFLTPPSGIVAGGFELTLLDVGQGLSAVVRTAEHTLVYDTGPGFYDGADTGQEVVVPYLQSQGIDMPDLAVVSHGDRDHAGGLASLRAAYPEMPVLAGEESRFTDVQTCVRGQFWDWDGVRFETLSPDGYTPHTGNNASCVVKVSGAGGSLLLTGDIMHKTEQHLLALDPTALRSDVLVAPHHGSNSSSSADFIAAVAPDTVLFPVGYRNRWGFPRPEVLERYRDIGAHMADTVVDGAIRIEFVPATPPAMVLRYRLDEAHFWTEH